MKRCVIIYPPTIASITLYTNTNHTNDDYIVFYQQHALYAIIRARNHEQRLNLTYLLFCVLLLICVSYPQI